jgi:hypothetical protein
MLIEDLPATLQPAKGLGMVTVLVDPNLASMDGFVDYEIGNILELGKSLKRMGVDLGKDPLFSELNVS